LAFAGGVVARVPDSPVGWLEVPSGYWTGPAGPLRSARGVPGIGEHTDDVLTELGFGAAEIDRLRASGLVGGPVRDVTAQHDDRGSAGRR
jgi:crotonobetainyl-CoA:carnitine CoA-transferase CaiB-like acyl-CoA transferase